MTLSEGRFAESFLRMRRPLARVELAASRLARDATTPAARGLASGISDIVQEIDREIVRSLRLLGPQPDGSTRPVDCCDLIPVLRARMAPVLGAHEMEWVAAASPDARVPLVHDRARFSRAILVMLGAGIDFVGRGGRFALEGCHKEEIDAAGLRLDARRLEGSEPRRSATDPLARPLSFALQSGGCLEVQHGENRMTASLWLPRPDPISGTSGEQR